jgi:hypothetical protein
MSLNRKMWSAAAIAAAVLLTGPGTARAEGDIRAAARALAAKSQKTVVTVKLVVTMKMMGQEEEQKVEVTGTVIDPSGLTVVSATEIDPSAAMKALLGPLMGAGGGRRGGAPDMKFESDVKETLLVLDDGTEIEADVILKDQDLDLAFVRPRDTTQKFEALALKPRGKAPELLEEVFVLSRLGRLQNRSTALSLGSVKAIVKGPRTFYICDGEATSGSLGCVAFDSAGAPLGVFVMKQAATEASDGSAQMGMLMRMLGGASNRAPSATILRSVDDVLEIAAQAKSRPAPERKKPEAPKEEPKATETPGGEKSAAAAKPDGAEKETPAATEKKPAGM